MSLVSTKEAADALGISVFTLYDWLSQSDAGEFVVRGQATTIEYYQGGRNGQGRIRIAHSEIERLLSLMKVISQPKTPRKKRQRREHLQHISTKLGRPDD